MAVKETKALEKNLQAQLSERIKTIQKIYNSYDCERIMKAGRKQSLSPNEKFSLLKLLSTNTKN